MSRRNPPGFSLLELIVVLTLLALLLGLLVPAVQKVRLAGLRTASGNKVRQVGVAVHHFSDATGAVPTIDGEAKRVRGTSVITGQPTWVIRVRPVVLDAVLPYLDSSYTPFQPKRPVPFYFSPLDPTNLEPRRPFPTSYSVNACVFERPRSLSQACSDGTTNTLMLAERYMRCGRIAFSSTQFSKYTPDRRATFADGGPILGGQNVRDVYPVVSSNGTLPNIPDVTFQVAPTKADCDHHQLQATTASGLLVTTCDGSVRTLSPGIAPRVFWSLVTPAGGEAVGDF